MRIRLIALASGLAALAATPSLALTISSAPPTRDVAQHLKADGPAAPGLQGSYVLSGRPQLGPGFSGGPQTSNTATFGFGGVTTTVQTYSGQGYSGQAWPGATRWEDRRDSGNPLSLSPRR